MQVLLNKCWRIFPSALRVFAAACLVAGARGEDFEFFENKIRPLLAEHCYKCHSAEAEKLKGGFLLDSKDGTPQRRRFGQARDCPRPRRSQPAD